MMLASEMARGFRPDAEGRLLVCPYWAGTMPVLRGPEGGKWQVKGETIIIFSVQNIKLFS